MCPSSPAARDLVALADAQYGTPGAGVQPPGASCRGRPSARARAGRFAAEEPGLGRPAAESVPGLQHLLDGPVSEAVATAVDQDLARVQKQPSMALADHLPVEDGVLGVGGAVAAVAIGIHPIDAHPAEAGGHRHQRLAAGVDIVAGPGRGNRREHVVEPQGPHVVLPRGVDGESLATIDQAV